MTMWKKFVTCFKSAVGQNGHNLPEGVAKPTVETAHPRELSLVQKVAIQTYREAADMAQGESEAHYRNANNPTMHAFGWAHNSREHGFALKSFAATLRAKAEKLENE